MIKYIIFITLLFFNENYSFNNNNLILNKNIRKFALKPLSYNKIKINNSNKYKKIKLLPLEHIPPYNKTYFDNYWYDPRIHNFGNIGFKGIIHAFLAPTASKLIDYLSYNNTNIRFNIVNSIPDEYNVVDFCCGIGFSTKKNSIGIDTSNEMLNIAKFINFNKTFINNNVENYGYENSCDVVTIMFATHEMHSKARRKVISNALYNAKKSVLIIDIDPYNFVDSLLKKPYNGSHFLNGEPYILNYINEMNSDINYCHFNNLFKFKLQKKNIITNHVVLWNFTKRF